MGGPPRLGCLLSEVAVIGAGPAGLGAAYALARGGTRVTVFEAADEVGGLARSVRLWGQTVELGAHLLLRVHPRIDALWRELIGDAFDAVPRRTRILADGRWLRYPYEPRDVARALGPAGVLRCVAGFARRRPTTQDDLESAVVAAFGRPAFDALFAAYVHKLHGVPASELDAGFAASLLSFQRSASLPALARRAVRRIPEPDVMRPHGGVGALLTRIAADVVARGGEVRRGVRVAGLPIRDGRVAGVEVNDRLEPFDHVISTAPLPVLVGALLDAPDDTAARARQLRTRGVVLVHLLIDGDPPFDDQWIYVTDTHRAIGRVANFSAWTPPGEPRPDRAILAVEICCDEADDTWRMADDALARLAGRELRELGLLGSLPVADAVVRRLPRAIPVLARGYAEQLEPVADWLAGVGALTSTGRLGTFANAGVHESLLLGMEAADSVLAR